MYKELDELETQYSLMEGEFYEGVKDITMDIEHLDPAELADKENHLEFQELKRLERHLKRVESAKINLLKREGYTEKELLLTSELRGLDLQELESRFEFKARERERALTKLFGRLNARIKSQILANEGVCKSSIRKMKPYVSERLKQRRLFEGIRD